MARSYYSTVFEQPADAVWNTIRDFNNYPVWVDGAGESDIEDGRSGDAVGAVRDVLYEGQQIRQRLLALSDVDRSQTYGFAGAPPAPLQAYQATIRVTPVVDGDRALVEWDATFDCEGARHAELAEFYRNAFATWLGSLRRALERQARAA
jgi:polyketide cyclase/dehydrase/lipid transport protein